MASNGLVANPSKTTLIVINKKGEEQMTVKVGETYIEQEHTAKLLGVQVDDEMGWKEQVLGKGGVISALNQRTHLIRRLRNHINPEKLRRIVDSLWTSKLRYGLWTATMGYSQNGRHGHKKINSCGGTKSTE